MKKALFSALMAFLTVTACAEEDFEVLDAGDTGAEGLDEDTFRFWTGWTSEEDPPSACPNRYVARGVDCKGKYCDDLKMDCHYTGRWHGDTSWLPAISEESPQNVASCTASNEWMTGFSCSGKYCDNVSLRCTELANTSTGSCTWSGWYSEEQAPFNAPSGRYIKGMRCNGKYCDNKQYRHCVMN
ncbi:hypothetical protein [Plesiocystis pacifica]|uniref:hypothetical protein n=1 Tax=Plesiocystis pacifica TaxID=191768 RepID=UPI0012F81F8F|nr:hypothetical protein [Plesiocystis pacifica]